MFYIGIDLGQAHDYTAICVIEKVYEELSNEQKAKLTRDFRARQNYQWGNVDLDQYLRRATPTLHLLRHIERIPLGTTYPLIIDIVKSRVETPLLQRKCHLVVDATGCGRPVVDLFYKSHMPISPVVITGGHKVVFEDNFIHAGMSF